MNIFDELSYPVVFGGPIAAGGKMRGGCFFIDAPKGVSWSVDLSTVDWVHPSDISSPSGVGPALFLFSADVNEGDPREGFVQIYIGKSSRKRILHQQSGKYTKSAGDAVLDLPFVKCPRVMEFAILLKWLTGLLKKIPEPWRILVLIVVEVLIVIGGVALALIVEALKSIVPVKATPFSWPDMPSQSSMIPEPISLDQFQPITSKLDVTPSLIVMQTAVSAIYVALETLS